MSRTAGFSLIEVLCAILILGIALVGLTQGVTTALSASKESELQTTAALIAAERIELLRADGYLIEGTDEDEGTGSLALYRWRESVNRTRIEGLFEVEVVVEHAKLGESIYQLRTLLFDPLEVSSQETPGPASTRPRDRERRR